jgi:polysaccharide deacetylase family protein (PEP-CTERM system associated)
MAAAGTPPPNAFTVDLEEWFHICGVGGELAPANWDRLPSRVESTTRTLLDMLDGTGIHATFFVVGWVAERHPRLIREVMDAGHDVGSHGYNHQRVYELGPHLFRDDLRRSLDALRGAGAAAVSCFRAPEWSINDRSLWALQTLASEGIARDASMAPLRIVGSVRYPRVPHVRATDAGPVMEYPPLVADRFGHVMPMGWGWGLRMSSPRRVLRTIEAVNRAGGTAVLTVHPWELDPDPPRMQLPPRLHFAHYFRLGGFARRLREILKEGSFGSLNDLSPAPVEADLQVRP